MSLSMIFDNHPRGPTRIYWKAERKATRHEIRRLRARVRELDEMIREDEEFQADFERLWTRIEAAHAAED